MRWDDEDVIVPWWQARSFCASTAAMGWGRRRRWVHTVEVSRLQSWMCDFAEEPPCNLTRTSPDVLVCS